MLIITRGKDIDGAMKLRKGPTNIRCSACIMIYSCLCVSLSLGVSGHFIEGILFDHLLLEEETYTKPKETAHQPSDISGARTG